MGFNTMFSSLAGEGENSDRIFYKNGVKVKHMSGKQPIMFSILPALDPTLPDNKMAWLPSILPDKSLSDWGNGAYVYRGIGHSSEWKERFDIVSLSSVGEECPMDALYKFIRNDPTWQYLTDDGKFGDRSPDRKRATLPPKRALLFCNVFLPNEQVRVAHLGIFTKSIANKLIGDNGLVMQPSPTATDAAVQANYLAAYANGDITDPNGAPQFVVEKGHDKGEMSAYELKYALDAGGRVIRVAAPQEVMESRYNLTDLRSYLNILTPEQIVNLLIQELNGRSPAGYHEYALLKLVFGSKYQIPEPPSAPAATSTIPSGFTPQPAAAPVAAPVTPQVAPAVQTAPTAAPAPVQPTSTLPPAAPANEASVALASAVAAGVVQAPAPAAVPAPAPAPAPAQVTGDPVPRFDKDAFLARLAKGGQQ